MNLPLESPEARLHQIKQRRLEIAAITTEWRSDYFSKGIARSKAERAALDAEDARLALELSLLFEASKQAAAARRVQEKKDLLGALQYVLELEGKMHLWQKAQETLAHWQKGEQA